MNGKTETERGGFDSLLLFTSIAILAAGVYGFYHFAEMAMVYRVLGVLGAVVLAGVIATRSAVGHAAWDFLVTSRTEVRKVVWPTRTETVQTTLYVMVVVLIVGIILWLLDMFLVWALQMLSGQGG